MASLDPVDSNRRQIVRRLSIAPMLDWTNRHFRTFFRLLSRHAFLYTEMVSVAAILHGDRQKLLRFSEFEKPLALQLGGDDPAGLAECAAIAEDCGYDEINLNVGCPSDRVQSGRFGACLMANPQRVAEAVMAMKKITCLPVTVKHRIGIDHLDRFEDLVNFVRIVDQGGCDRFIVHARIALLGGLSPKENRTIPPLRYEDVYHLKGEFPQLLIEINGGITRLDQVVGHLRHVDGVMVGRAAYGHPYHFANTDRLIFADPVPPPSRLQVVQGMIRYLDNELVSGQSAARQVINPMLGLFKGLPSARAWRRFVTEQIQRCADPVKLLQDSLQIFPPEVLLAAPDPEEI